MLPDVAVCTEETGAGGSAETWNSAIRKPLASVAESFELDDILKDN